MSWCFLLISSETSNVFAITAMKILRIIIFDNINHAIKKIDPKDRDDVVVAYSCNEYITSVQFSVDVITYNAIKTAGSVFIGKSTLSNSSGGIVPSKYLAKIILTRNNRIK